MEGRRSASNPQGTFDMNLPLYTALATAGFTLSADTDMVLTELVNLAEYRKVCRTKTLIETPNGKVMSVKEPFTADLKTWILGHHPDAVIINEVLANLPL
jgi:hypothetical protein